MTAPLALPDTFWPRVDRSGECWLWMGSRSAAGYGRITIAQRQYFTHRLAYEVLVGPIPEGLEIDHLCRVTACLNPEHLEAVTHRENILRSTAPMAALAIRTACSRGHEYADGSFIIRRGARECVICRRAAANEYGKRRRRADGPVRGEWTHCAKGHEYTPENTRTEQRKGGGTKRVCRTCVRDRAREYRRAKSEGLLRDTGEREPSNDAAGRNTDKLDRIYELVGAR